MQDAAFGPAGQQDWEGGERGLLTLPHFIKKKKVNEMCDFLCNFCSTARIPLLIKSIHLTILTRSLRNQYLLPKELQPL